MTWGWPALAALFVGSYALKATGLVALANRHLPTRVEELLGLLPAALFGALIVVSTFGDGQTLVIDARAAGLVAGLVTVALRAPFLVVVISAAGVTAALRALT